ncbi:hypothetical protein GCK72_016846 [Caenorhabditis remanei]|uniref:Uncharacterized protein n=1 Tax=Caenorhabditis remanei TaxID=31234 RepID=A0A6A5G5J2_CAERE|nr:hypothetical protein GCK72_016846 [Caenorhabditis remanei]KAF1750298.1 hypothetical protein GCK72_016846 [Caenorhabditis remanei]
MGSSLSRTEENLRKVEEQWLENKIILQALLKRVEELELDASYPYEHENTEKTDDSLGSSTMSDVEVPELEKSVGNSISTVSDEEPEELEEKLKRMDREFRIAFEQRQAVQMEEINRIRREREEMERGMNN